ncbi:MAG TPA: hypothetical protein VEK07_21065 [Polyangiaceae bacterium]|nr:hypothetical protein [Polyangiaceae bacterium]
MQSGRTAGTARGLDEVVAPRVRRRVRTIGLTIAAAFALLAACSSSTGPGVAALDGGGDGGVTLASCLAGAATIPAPAACSQFVSCLENSCQPELAAAFGSGYASGPITGPCAGFESCAMSSQCTTAAGTTCAESTSSACQQDIQALVSCGTSPDGGIGGQSCLALFVACATGLLNGLYDAGGSTGDAGMDATLDGSQSTRPDSGITGAQSDGGDASSSDATVTGVPEPDAGSDAGCPVCDGGCCQQMELTSTGAPPISLVTDGTTLVWTANGAGADGGVIGTIFSIAVPTSLGIFTLNSLSGHSYAAIAASSSNFYFVDQTAGSVMSIPKQYTATPSPMTATAVVPSGVTAGIAVQQTTADGGPDGGATGNVYFGSSGASSSVGWVALPAAGPAQGSMNLPGAFQLAVDSSNVYALGPSAVGACALGTSCGSAYTPIASGLGQGQGLFSDGTNVWITDQGSSPGSATGAIYKCPVGGSCGTPPPAFASGLNHPFAIVADANYVYWTEAYLGGTVMRCPAAGSVCANPEVIAHAYETPTALVQDTYRIYWADVNNISMLAK